MSEKKTCVKIAISGCGNRSRGVISNLLRDSHNQVEIVAVFDPDAEVMKQALECWNAPQSCAYSSYEAALAAPGVEWMMIFSPPLAFTFI
jgi:predicted dehydrogenase